MMCKLAVMVGALASTLLGDTLDYPVLTPDGQNLADDNPGIGARIYAIPGSLWLFGFNDNLGVTSPFQSKLGDFDFNDAVGWLKFSQNVGGIVFLQANYLGIASAADNDVRVGVAGNWMEPGDTQYWFKPTGSEVVVTMWDETRGNTFVTGTRNAWVTRVDVVPEPGEFLLVGGSLLGLGLLRRRFL